MDKNPPSIFLDKKKYHIDYEKVLNEQQLEAVMFNRGPLLVIAGAGSGKTRTLTYRTARLVEDGIAPYRILLLTFTRKAAQEMLNRASSSLDARCEKVSGGTFHSFAYSVLNRYSSKIGFKQSFTILDRADSEAMISVIRKEMKLENLPKTGTIASILSKSVNKNIDIEHLIRKEYPHFINATDEIKQIDIKYKLQKRESIVLDYDDLLIFMAYMLEDNKEIREKLSLMYQFIMVDEYQDTNHLQAKIVKLLAGDSQNIMAVGDDSQSIYAFRGADFRNIIDFPKTFSNVKLIRLEENYRSLQPILNLTNEVIKRAKEKFNKKLFTRKKGGPKPVMVTAADENSQSLFVVDKIIELTDKGTSLNDIAVLFRSGYHSFDLEIELTVSKIPYIKVGGFKFVDSAHIKDVLSHIKVLINPYDRISWIRIFSLLDKIGTKTAIKIYNSIIERKEGYKGVLKENFKKSKDFERLQKLFASIDISSMSTSQIGEAVIDYYQEILEKKYDDHPKRLKDLKQLIMIMNRYSNIEFFVIDITLEPPNASIGENLTSEHKNDGRLVLSTVHSAKGLEWETVFIIWALDGRFPSIYSTVNEESVEEERRLMYVAATRAKKNLFFVCPGSVYDRSTNMLLTNPSRFIDPLSEKILERKTTWQ